MKKNLIVTIDGPAGAGKTTIAKEVAKRLGFFYLDTGAMYRALTLKALTEGITVEDKEKLVEMVKETILIAKKPSQQDLAGRPARQSSPATKTMAGKSGGDTIKDVSATDTLADSPASRAGMRIWVDGEEVTDKIRTEEVTNNIWWVCRVKDVRKKMKKLQREIGSSGRIVVEGRDIGTVVFPKAPFKFYLDASIDERAKRRWLEQTNKGIQSDLEKIKQDIKERDNKDFTREIAPLKKAEDAVNIDTTGLTIEGVIEKIIQQVNKS